MRWISGAVPPNAIGAVQVVTAISVMKGISVAKLLPNKKSGARGAAFDSKI
jgi:hypothetical protein